MVSNTKKQLQSFFLVGFQSCSLLWCSIDKKLTKKDKAIKDKLIFDDEFNGDAYNSNYWSSNDVKKEKSAWSRFVMDDADLVEVKTVIYT